MPKVLITTDFSEASKHGLDYACMLLADKDVSLNLVHIFPVPVTYTSDGMALAAMGDAIGRANDLLQLELQRIRAKHPDIKIEGNLITGSFLETLRLEIRLNPPLFIIIGTTGFTDLYLGDDDPLSALRMLNVPVLFVPYGAEIKPIKNIAYASNYAHVGPQTPIHEIMKWISLIGAQIHVVHTDTNLEGVDEKQAVGGRWLKNQLSALNPTFHWVQQTDVITGLTGFVNQHNIDCVLVVPRTHGIWQNIFHKSRTKALARLNTIPVIAFHEIGR